MTKPIKVIIELTVDPDKYDLREYRDDAVWGGWGDNDENGAWYLAEAIASEWTAHGLLLEVVA